MVKIMDAAEYIYSVEEQLRAYEFSEVDGDRNSEVIQACFYKNTEGFVNTTEEVVTIIRLNDVDVNTARDAIETSKSFFDWKVEDGLDVTNRRWVYALLVVDTAPGPVRTVVKRMAGKFDEGFVLPLLATMDTEGLVYERPGNLQQLGIHKKLSQNAQQYFKP